MTDENKPQGEPDSDELSPAERGERLKELRGEMNNILRSIIGGEKPCEEDPSLDNCPPNAKEPDNKSPSR